MKKWLGITLISLNTLFVIIGTVFLAMVLEEIPYIASLEFTLQNPLPVLLMILIVIVYSGLIMLEMYLVMIPIMDNMD